MRFSRVLSPPLNLLIRWPSDPIRRPTLSQGTGAPSGRDGRFSTASEPQWAHRPRAATSTCHTSPVLTFSLGLPDISRGPFAFLALRAHQARRSAGVVCAMKSAHEANRGAGDVPDWGGGDNGAGTVRARIVAACSGRSPDTASSNSGSVGASRGQSALDSSGLDRELIAQAHGV